MHGVKKTEITEHEQEVREREQNKKKLAYETCRDRLRYKRENVEYDEEVLELSEILLKKNADIYSLWNMRRLTILEAEQRITNETEDGQNDAIRKLYDNELKLTLDCITTHPKSYGAWHHRAWCIQRQSEPDYQHELKLCTKCLQLDERNFHCWDYRRTICRLANISQEDELSFSDQALKHNLCNYSAWHYRTTLLPMLRPPTSSDLPMESEQWLAELKLATEACVVDAEDSSAWIYSSWLFAYERESENVTPLFITVDGDIAYASFSRAVRRDQASILINAAPVSNANARSDYVWQLKSSDLIGDTIDVIVNEEKYTLKRLTKPHLVYAYQSAELMRTKTLSDCKRNALTEFLETCDKLIKEEPELIWPHQLVAQCMLTLDRHAYAERIVQEYNTLMQIDSQRKHLYRLLLSEHELMALLKDKLPKYFNGTEQDFNLRIRQASNVPWRLVSYLLPLEDLSLSDNPNAAHILPKLLHYAPNLYRVDLQGTGRETVDIISENLPSKIEFLSVASCEIEHADQLASISASTSLKRLLCAENPMCNNEAELGKLRQMTPEGRRLMPFWL